MNRMSINWLIGILLLAMGLSRNVSADISEETQLTEAQTKIDQHAAAWSPDQHIDKLSKHFQVPAKTVQELSAHNQGWGAVTIELAMARQFSMIHSQTFPSMTDALRRVESLRVDGKEWGDIARKLEFGLGPVIQEAKNTAEGLRQDDLALTQKHEESNKVEENRSIIREEHQIAQDKRHDDGKY
jgi:hypothetical protein